MKAGRVSIEAGRETEVATFRIENDVMTVRHARQVRAEPLGRYADRPQLLARRVLWEMLLARRRAGWGPPGPGG